MKKRVLAIAMSLAMTLSLLPVSALATETGETPEEETSPVNSIQETNSSEKAENQDQELTADVENDEDTQVTVGDSVENPVAKIGETGYETLQAAIEDAEDGDTVTLTADATGGAVTFSKSGKFVLDLNDHVFTSTDAYDVIMIKSKDVDLTIQDGTLEGHGTATYGIYVYALDTDGDKKVDVTCDNVTVTLDNVDLDVTDQGLGVQGLNSNNNLIVKNSSVSAGTAIYFPPKTGSLIIEDSNITGIDNAIVIKGGEVEISGNSIVRATGEPKEGEGPYEGDPDNPETFPQTGSAIYVEGGYVSDAGGARPINVNIYGGTFISENSGAIAVDDAYLAEDEGVQTIQITGGTFSTNVSKYIPSGMTWNEETHEVEISDDAVASVKGIPYDDLQEAINTAGNGDTVTLLKDVPLEKQINISTGKNITLDLSTYTIKVNEKETFTGFYALIENQGNLTIRGSGTIDATEPTSLFYAIENKSGGELTVVSGTIIGRFEGIHSIGGTVAIKGGTVSAIAEDAARNMAVHAYGGEVSVSGDAKITGVNTAITVAGSKLSILGNASLSGMFGVILLNKAENNSEGAQPASLTMTGGTIQANGGFALSGNNLKSAGCSAKITGGSLEQTTGETCIYWPMEGSLTVGGNAVVEGGSGIEAKMGTIAIQGSAEIRGTGAYLADEPIANGSQADGSAILVSTQMYGNNNGQYISSPNLTVTITGGTLQSTQGNAVTVYNTEDIDAQEAEVSITGGELNAAVGKAAVQVVINANTDGEKTSTLTTENGENAFETAKSQTTVIVSASAALAAVDQTGGVAYYTDANDALESANNSANENVQPHVYVLDDGSVDSGKLSNKDVSLTTAQNVDLLVSSGVPGMIVQGTTNQDGSKTYKLVENTQDVELSAPTVTLSADRTYVYTGEKITLTASASHNDPSITFGYVWYKDGKVMSGASENTLTVTESGSYSVGVVAIKEGNDSNYSSEEGRSNVINCTVTARPSVDPDRPSGGGSSSSDSGDYLITVDRVSGGRVTVQPGRADRGDTVTITVYPNDGYELDELVVTDSRGNEIDLDARSATRFTFTMPSGKVTVEASFVREGGQTQIPQTTFADVPASAWYCDAVEYVYENGLMSGVSGGRFAPDDTLTRAMLVQTLYAMEGRPAAASAGFADVASGDWYASAVNWAAANGVVSGVSETGFGPNNVLTREQLALILYRFAQYKGYDVTGTSDLAAYADGSSVSSWAAEAMGWAVDAGLISGVGGNQIAPTGTASRAQVAQILMNFCENVAR